MYTFLMVVYVIVCLFLILVVLLQAGKGGGMGIAFGSSGSQAVLGSSGAGNMLTRITAICATMFFVLSLALAWMSSQHDSKRLQELAAKKAVAAKAQEDKTKAALADLDKVRSAIDKATAKAGDAGPAIGTAGDASGAAPAGLGLQIVETKPAPKLQPSKATEPKK